MHHGLPLTTDSRRGPVSLLFFVLIFAFGVWLRLDQITLQVIADDEWHALNFLQENSYGEIFRNFGAADHSIPLTLYDKLVADTFGLSEIAMRAPVLALGILALLVVPWMLQAIVGARTSLVFAALLAISPLHVYFSRYARPYSAMFLFGIVGALAFYRWRTSGRRGWAVLYAACAILGPWFQPVLLPFCVAPFVYVLLRKEPDGQPFSARLRSILPLGIVTAIGLAALLGPPIVNSFGTIQDRAGDEWFSGDALKNTFDLVSGAHLPATGFLFGVACLAGALSLSRRRRELCLFLSFLTLCQLVAIGFARPDGLEASIVAVRYALPVLAFVLLLAAEGLTFGDDFLRREWRWWPRPLLALAIPLALVAYGPLVPLFYRINASYFRPNSFTNHALYTYTYAQRSRWDFAGMLIPPRWSAFYLKLAESAGTPASESERIVEAPWYIDWAHMPFVLYQKLHKRPVSMGFLNEAEAGSGPAELPWPDERFRFANFVHLGDYDALREQGVRWVILHKDLTAELPVGGEPLTPIEPWVRRYMKRFGPPYFEDEFLYVFDVRATP